MQSRGQADVLVIGAGPAGAWAARCLARGGARVRLFDASHPREKPCGGGVTGRALALVGDAVDPSALGAVRVDGALFDDPRTVPARVTLRADPAAEASLNIFDRRRFDGALLEAAANAGAEYHQERVLDVGIEDGRARLRTGRGIYEGSWVIGADGANSLTRRRLQRPFRRDQLSITAGVYAHDRSDTTVVVRFVAQPAGYIWSFPRQDHLAIGICAQGDETRAAELKHHFDAWLRGSGLAEGARLEPYAWPIPSLSPRDLASERPAGPGYLLVGDAAGLVDPITREGIFFALRSGGLAADAIRSGTAVPERYVLSVRRHAHDELIRAARLKGGFFRGRFTHLLVDALRQSAAVRSVMVDLVGGVQPYRTLKSRLVRTFEWRLAWQLLLLEAGRGRRAGMAAHRAT